MNRFLERILAAAVLVTLCATQVGAQPEVKSLAVSAPVRYDHRLETATGEAIRSRFQYQLAIRYDAAILQPSSSRSLHIKGLLGTGEKYTSQWNRFYDRLDDAEREQPINMRQIYVEWDDTLYWVQLGVIPPVKGKVSATSLDRDGWLRGGRLVMRTWADGRFEFVGGALDRLDDPNGFQWWEHANYAEFEWTQPYGDRFRAEVGLVRLSDAFHVRAESRFMGRPIPTIPVEFAAEYLHNLERDAFAYDFNVMTSWRGASIFVEYSNVEQDFGLLGALSNDFFTFGHLYHLTVRYRPKTLNGFGLFFKGYRGEETSEFKTGLSYNYRYEE